MVQQLTNYILCKTKIMFTTSGSSVRPYVCMEYIFIHVLLFLMKVQIMLSTVA